MSLLVHDPDHTVREVIINDDLCVCDELFEQIEACCSCARLNIRRMQVDPCAGCGRIIGRSRCLCQSGYDAERHLCACAVDDRLVEGLGDGDTDCCEQLVGEVKI